MGENTDISWTNHTWNPWWGCSEIGPECGAHAPTGSHGLCYAAVFASRGLHKTHAGAAVDGKWTGDVTRSSPAVWAAPFKWGPSLVFTCSMSDFGYERVPLPWFSEALDVIERTDHLTYQMLTKRPAVILRRLAELGRPLPRNVWIGASVGHVHSMPLLKPLRRIDATLRFLSCEPLLTPLPDLDLDGIGWVITGGQSGPDAVPTHPDSFRHLRDLCVPRGIPFHFKQWGEWLPHTPIAGGDLGGDVRAGRVRVVHPSGRDDVEILHATGGRRQSEPGSRYMIRVGKKASGAMLDGREWREFPRPVAPLLASAAD